MIIFIDELNEILMKYNSYHLGTPPNQALGIEFYKDFKENPRSVKDTATFHTADGGTLVVDLDDNGTALGIEML